MGAVIGLAIEDKCVVDGLFDRLFGRRARKKHIRAVYDSFELSPLEQRDQDYPRARSLFTSLFFLVGWGFLRPLPLIPFSGHLPRIAWTGDCPSLFCSDRCTVSL